MLEGEVAYWREALAGLAPLDLPTDRPRPARRRGRGALLPWVLPPELSAALARQARTSGATLFMTLAAGFAALLCRHSGQEDVAFGSPIANRTRAEIEGLIGFFVNTWVLRSDLSGAPTFPALVSRVRRRTLGAFAHQDLPFEKVVSALAPPRDNRRTPLFQVLFVLQNVPVERLELPGLLLEPLELGGETAKFDLTLTLGETASGLAGSWEYDRDLFDGTTIARLSGHFERLLDAIAAGASALGAGLPVAALPILGAAQRAQLAVEWNDRPGGLAGERSLLSGIEAQARRTPEAVALACGGEQLTYGALVARAQRFARRLRRLGRRGVGPDLRVGLCLDRSPDLVVGLLATLGARGAYVVLDPALPAERLAFLLRDSGVAMLLSRSELAGRLPAGAAGAKGGPPVLLLDGAGDRDPIALDAPPAETPEGEGLDDLLYVIYTSGSTGQPKGAGVYQRGFVNLVHWYVEAFGLSREDRFLVMTSAGFDLTQKNLFAPLLVGGVLVLAPPAAYDPREIASTIERHRITRLNCTPSAFYPLLTLPESDGPERLASLRSVFLGGEPIAPARLAPWRRSVGRLTEVVNTYGPTECTDVVAWKRLAPTESSQEGVPVPLGRPLPGVRLLVLDSQLSPLPLGVAGQLAVGGVGVGAGYLGRPALTAEKFVPDPCAAEPGARLYWTGDLARTLPDGELDFLGRVDDQVKVRGFRIELGEIEAALAACPGVDAAAVLVSGDRSGERRLVAYVASREARLASADLRADLRAALAARLPEYMVPASFVILPVLPLTANGKVDRKALPAPEEGLAPPAGRVAPRTESERLLADLFGQALGLAEVGVTENFFDLGGNSISGAILINRVQEALGTLVPVMAIFDHPTVAALAAHLDHELALDPARAGALSPLGPRRLPAVPEGRERPEEPAPIPLSFAQERLWFLEQLDPGSATYHIPGAFRLRGALDLPVFRASFGEIVSRHGALRTTFALDPSGQPIQKVVEDRGLGIIPLVDLGGLPDPAREGEGRRLAKAEGRRPFDLGRGPLLRVGLVRLGPREHLAVVTMHHIVSDGWSMGILLGELGALYRAFAAGRPSPLPPLPIQYTDFALWQRGWQSEEALEAREADLAYWRETLAGLAPLDLPTDRPRRSRRRGRGALRPVALPDELSRSLARVSREEGATLFMTLAAGLAALLSRYSGQEDVALGFPVANRNRAEIEGLIGFFVNTQVLRGDLSGEPTFPALLARVRRRTHGAFSHQDLPFEKIVSALAPPRDTSRTPLFQVLLVLQNVPAERPELPGLTLEPLALGWEVAKLDLTLTLTETAEGLVGTWEYDRDLFDGTTIARLSGHLERLLSAAVAPVAPASQPLPVAALPILGAAERAQLAVEWNDRPGERWDGLSLREGIESQARRTPEAVALVGSGEQLTYGALVARAARFARRLRQLGVLPGVPVGLGLERSPELVVGLLAILGARGAYVVLDPALPAERLAFLLRDSGVAVVLSRSDLAGRLPADGPPVLLMDGAADLASGALPREAPEAAELDDLLYVIYTSGSTGQPKGAGVYQRGFGNLLHWYREELGLSAADRFLVVTSAAFDLTQKNFFAPLLSGGLLVLADPVAYDPGEIAATIERHGITRLNCTPSAFYPLLTLPETGSLERLASLSSVALGGEPIAPAQLASWRLTVGRRTEVINTYGPTECTDVVAWKRLAPPAPPAPPELPESPESPESRENADALHVPLGRPVPGVRLLVLDAQLSPLPLGVAGQLAVGGMGVGAGYLGRPALTAEKFVPDPFAAEPGARLYWTGDLARTLRSGDLDFLGRVDDQVKVRGFRIELGEIESALAACPGVSAAAVLARAPAHGDRPGERRLVAYVSSREAGLASADLRAALAARLPEYMMPARFVILPALPLTANGKVDRKALPAPEENLETAALRVAPRTESERFLAGLFCRALGLPEVGVTESFFDLGGDSISGAILVNRVREALGKAVPVVALFDHPTVAGLAAYLQGTLGDGHPGAAAGPGPRRRSAEESAPIPLSFAQERLWFLEQLDPGSAAYHIPGAFRLRGDLDLPALRASFGEIVRRHGALRTTFTLDEEGHPLQVVGDAVELALPLLDLGRLPAASREREGTRLAREEAARPFDLRRGPLFRAGLVRLGPREHLALVTMHHVVSDGWSLAVLVGELGVLYRACAAGEPSPLPPLPVQYTDFSVWQREWLAGETLAGEMAYWRQALAGLAPLDLPTDRPRPARRRGRGALLPCVLPLELSAALARQARTAGATLFMTLAAGLAALLSRHSGQEEVALGSPIANRSREEIEGLIGFFVNTWVLRSDLSGAPTFPALVARVRRRTLGAFAHQDLPFEKVVSALAPPRDNRRTPLFQVLFVLQNVPVERLELPGLTLEPLALAGETAKFDLTLTLGETASGFAGSWEYDRDLFDRTTIARLSGHFERLLGAATSPASGVGLPVAALPILGAAERAQLEVEWNDSPGERSEGQAGARSLLAGIERQARRTPEVVALVCGGEQVTYGALVARAERFAQKLRRLRGPGLRVGLCLDRSPDLVVGLLATLGARGAYVVLDPSLPAERLAFLLRDSGLAVVLTRSELAGRLPESRPPVLLLDGAGDGDLPAPPPAPPEGGSLDDLLYVIYTSGSTGQPKGAGVYQRGFLNLVHWYVETFGLSGEDRFFVMTSPAFDLTQKNFFAPFLVGGLLVLAPPAAYDPQEIAATLERHRITRLNCTPSAFYPLLPLPEADGPERLSSLRSVFLGGEPIAPARLASWRRSAGRLTEVVNTYGPTECTDVVAWKRLAPPDVLAAELPDASPLAVPLGRPLPGVRLLVLDRQLSPSPLGVCGQLAVGGVGVGAGYLGRPGLTAEKFVPDPFADEPGARLYFTGDLARALPDGDLDFLGRVDDQVKVRGFRIELGEIEAALAACPGVSAVAVLARAAREDRPGERRLVAYVSSREALPEPAGWGAELREALAARLPESMVPARFVILPVLPLTANGKVDRKALPAPEESWDAPAGRVAPRTASERVLAGLFCQVLGLAEVGVTESFFGLGGDSISGAILINRLPKALGKTVPVVAIFDHPTVAGLAACLEGTLGAVGDLHPGALSRLAPREPVQAEQEPSSIPLSFAQERLWFLEQLDPGSAAYHIPGAFRLRGDLDLPALRASLGEIVRRHAALRTTFAAAGGQGQAVQVVQEAVGLPLPLADLGGLPAVPREREGMRLAREEAVRPFDLTRGPLFRAGLVRLGAREHLALVTMHHMVSDGWSMGVLVSELGGLYRAATQGEPSPLPPLPIQYTDFAVWQRDWLAGEVLEAEIAYWRQALAGLPPLDLPTDRPRPLRRRGRGALRPFALPGELSRSLARRSRTEGVTLFMTLTAGLAALLSRYSGQEDVAVGSPIANRTRREVEGLIGFFVNTLVLRSDLSGAPTFPALLARVRRQTLEAFSHQDLPFEKVVSAVAPERDMSRTPLFQVLLVLQNTPVQRLELPGVTLEPLELGWEVAKFDLTLTLGETASGLAGIWEYDRDLFDGTTVERLARHFERLLGAISAAAGAGAGAPSLGPGLPVAALPILGAAERAQLEVEWNDVPGELVGERSLVEGIESQARRTPEAVALVCGGERLTYGALVARAERFARRLRRLDVRPGLRVGMYLDRSPELVVGLLATLGAGGAYVVLDPSLPAERLALLLRDSGVAVILSRSDLAGRLPDGGPPVLLLDGGDDLDDLGGLGGLGGLDMEDGAPGVPHRETPGADGLDDLLYLIYTSGSTGLPKGAGVYQRGFVHLLHWYVEAFGLAAGDRFLVVTSAAFDLTQKNLFAPLLVGGLLVLAPPGAYDPEEIVATIEHHGITRLNCTPSAFYPLLTLPAPGGLERLSSLQSVFLGGEPIAPAQLAPWRRTVGRRTEVVNTYGPTECTDVVAWKRLAPPGSQAEDAGAVPLGRPVPGVRLQVLDSLLSPLPLGVPGQLAVGGVGVGMGYLGRPELTAEKFVPDPFAGEPGSRLYWTGDLARTLPDGDLDFLGRIDHQVKVRGFRIELGEIEAVLLAAPGVREAVVLARRDAPGDAGNAGNAGGDARLVAYVVGPEEEGLTAALGRHLAERLPEYMLPAAFVRLAALPLTPNGKLDRKALPAPEWKVETAYLAPRTAVEEVLAGLFAEVLGIARVGVEDSFFRLGGHSLLATQLVSRVQGTFRVKLPLRRLFESPTVEALAAAVVLGEEKTGQSEKIARALLRLRERSAVQR
jgi:amino acid adenylation domain-containing protein